MSANAVRFHQAGKNPAKERIHYLMFSDPWRHGELAMGVLIHAGADHKTSNKPHENHTKYGYESSHSVHPVQQPRSE
jgi:hypothetical protein